MCKSINEGNNDVPSGSNMERATKDDKSKGGYESKIEVRCMTLLHVMVTINQRNPLHHRRPQQQARKIKTVVVTK